MKLGLFSNIEPLYKNEAKKVIEILKKYNLEFEVYNNLKKAKCDILIVVGGDGTILKVVRELKRQMPILGVSKGVKFLTEIEFEDFEISLKKLLKREYKIEERMRLACEIDGVKLPNALNDIVLTTSKGGGVIRYSLKLDDKLIWRDSGDGVIISTPTGSTAYSLSAGGPIVVENADTVSIVPICSMNNNKPLIVNDDSKIVINDIFSTSGCDVVIDGQKRLRIKNKTLRIRKIKSPALFIRFTNEYLRIFGKLREKAERVILSKDAPPSAKFIFKLLTYEGALTQKEIIAETNLPGRTVRHALDYLLENGLIEKRTTLKDTRQAVYSIIE
jgi:NAD+ kinase